MRLSRTMWIGFAVIGVAGWLSSIGIGTHRSYRMALVLAALTWAARAMARLSPTADREPTARLPAVN